MAHGADQGWVRFVAAHLHPKEVRDCSNDRELETLESELEAQGSLSALASSEFKECCVERSGANAVVGIEHAIHVCAKDPGLVGPGGQFLPQSEAMQRIWPRFHRSAVDATLYSIPYVLGPRPSSLAQAGRLLTNNPVLATKFARLARVSARSEDAETDGKDLVRIIHLDGNGDDRGTICYFPERRIVWTIGIDADTFLRHHAHALRLATWPTAEQGWLPVRANILHVTSPRGDTHHILCAPPLTPGDFPAAFREPEAGGWRFQVLPSSVIWLRANEEGALCAVSPERGAILDVDGMPLAGNGVLSRALRAHSLFQGVAMTAAGHPWWRGIGRDPVYPMRDWAGRERRSHSDHLSAYHASAYVVAPRGSDWERAAEQPEGVAISAIAFISHRSSTIPFVAEATGWNHGCFVGATRQDESHPSHPEGGPPLLDPMGMRSSCLCTLGDYLAGWLSLGRKLRNPPKIYRVNPSRTKGGRERLLRDATVAFPWIVQRVEGNAPATSTVAGFVPTKDSLEWTGFDAVRRSELLRVDPSEWLAEVDASAEILEQLGRALPFELRREQALLAARVDEMGRRRTSA